MNVFALFSFISFILFFQAGVYFLYKDRRNLLNRVFVLLSFLFALYALSYNLFFDAKTLDEVYLYDRIASPGWIFFPVVSIWFAIVLTKNKSYIIRLICYLFLLPTAFYSLYVALTDLESVKLFYFQNENWFYTPYDHTFAYMIFIVYLIVSVLVMYFVLIGWFYSAENNRQKMQAKIMLAALSLFFVLTSITNLVLPVIQLDFLPALAPINALTLIGGMFLTLVLHQKVYIAPEHIYNLIHLHVKEFVFMLDKDLKIFSANQYSLRQLKYNPYDLQKKDPNLFFSDFNMILQAVQKMSKRDDSPQIRMDLLARDGKSIPVLLSVIKVRNSYQKVEGYALVCTNYRQKLQLKEEIAERVRTEKNLYQIRKELEYLVKKRTHELQEASQRLQQEVVERKRAEQQIKADLEQKIELVQEVHHRVKNNIQMIISLINMLCSHPVIDGQTSDHLRDIAEKVRYISRIHEDFYASPHLSRIAFSPYLKKTIGELYSNFGYSSEIVFKLNIADEYLEINQAIPLGIIFNELLVNALKHAFAYETIPDEKSVIRVEFFKRNGIVTMLVIDNGIGLPSGFSLANSGNVGLKLVRILTKDHLRGIVESSVNHGTRFKVTFDENQIT
ncbi:MAG: PAS domain-containing protein [Bacteroidales bacterium]|nr:PAS domain-containing protein [Bacteroidales bacterium]